MFWVRAVIDRLGAAQHTFRLMVVAVALLLSLMVGGGQQARAADGARREQPGGAHRPGSDHKQTEQPRTGSDQPQSDGRREQRSIMNMARNVEQDRQANASTGPALTLADLEQMALKNNPTLAQAEAAVRAAEGRRKQAGLYPNPTIGYSGQEFAFNSFDSKSEHFFFIQQDIITGGKLSKSRKVVEGERAEAEANADGQRIRVSNAVRMLYFEALGAQQTLDLRRELVRIADDASHTSEQLLNVGQADQPDVLEAQNEAERAEIDLVSAQDDRDEVWRMLAAVVGKPSLPVSRLEGSLEDGLQELDEKSLLDGLLNGSPEIKRAEAGVRRAKAALDRAEAERAPDLFVKGEVGYSTEFIETRAGIGARTGPEASVEFGIRLRLFDRNQGNIAAAAAGVTEAENELRRQQLILRARFASTFREYQDAFEAARRYREGIIPRAQMAYDLYSAKYKEMAAAYPQVIIAERSLNQTRLQYIRWLVALQQSVVKIKGFLLTGGLDSPVATGTRATEAASLPSTR